MKKFAFLAIVTAALWSGSAHAQDFGIDGEVGTDGAAATTTTASTSSGGDGPIWDAGTMGLGFGIPSGGGGTFGMAYFLSPEAALRFDVGFVLSSIDDGMDRSTNWGLSTDVNYRMYRNLVDKVYMFIQPGLFLGIAANDADFGQRLSVALTGGIGVEYLFTPQWSVSGTTGGSLAFSNEFKNINLSTGTSALFVNFYW